MEPQPEGAPQHPAHARLGWVGVGPLAGVAALALVPTLGTLGYPSALLAAPLLALAGLRVGLRQLSGGARRPTVSFGALARQGLARLALVLGAALALIAASSVAQGNLDLAFGAACFALGPACAALCGWLCGLWAGALAERRVARALLAAAVPLGCLAVALLRLYRDPVAFAYDPFWGVLSGGVYDWDFELDATYVGYRAYTTAVCAAAALALSLALDPGTGRAAWSRFKASARRRPAAAGALLLYALGGLAVAAAPERLGFHRTAASLGRALPAERRSAHFVLRYRPDSAWARELDAVAAELEFAWAEHATRLGRTPRAPLTAWLFDSAEHKRALLGVGDPELALPWRRELYLQYRPWPHPVVPHELAHLFSAPFGDPVFGVALDPPRLSAGMIEGFAEALAEPVWGPLDVHDQAAILERLGERPALAALLGADFWGLAPARAYVAVGSFCAWLAEREGFAAVAALHRAAGDCARALGRPAEELEREWLAFLRARPVDPADLERERRRFERGSLFERPWIYRVARLGRRARRALAAGDLARAAELLAEMVALEPREPGHRLARARVLGGLARFDEAATELAALRADAAPTEVERGLADELEGDLDLARGALDRARGSYEAALARPLDEPDRRRLVLKRRACADPLEAPAWLQALAPFPSPLDERAAGLRREAAARALAVRPRHAALARYLLGAERLAAQDPAGAAAFLEAALAEADALPDAGFVRAARERLLVALAQRPDGLQRAAAVLARLSADSRGSGDRLRYARWARRLAFLAARRAPH